MNNAPNISTPMRTKHKFWIRFYSNDNYKVNEALNDSKNAKLGDCFG